MLQVKRAPARVLARGLAGLLVLCGGLAAQMVTPNGGSMGGGGGSGTLTDVTINPVTNGTTATGTCSSTTIVNCTIGLSATPALGTPVSGVMTNVTGLPVATGISGLGTGIATWLATPTSANLLAAMTTKTGTGSVVFGTSPTMTGVTLGDVTGAIQCLHVSSLGLITGTGSDCGSAGGSSAFSSLTTGNNTTATMGVGTGASLATVAGSTGTIAATTAPPFTWSVTQFGATTGVSDNTTAFAAAASACASAGSGVITVPSGTWILSQYTWNSACTLKGAGSSGAGATILKQKVNSNEDFIVSSGNGYGGATITQTWAASGSGTSTPTNGGGFEDILVDGNGVNQSGAGPYRAINAYAVGYTIRNARFTDSKGPCGSFDYNNAQQFQLTGSWNPTIDNATFDYCGLDINNSATVTFANASCLELGGPADFVATNIKAQDCAGDSIFEGHNVSDLYITAHAFSPTLANFWFEGYQPRGYIYVDGAINGQVGAAILNSKADLQIDMAQTTPASTAPGLQIGQASGGTPHCHSFFQTVPGACSGGSTTGAVAAGYVLHMTSEGFTSEDIVFTGFEDGGSITIASDHTAGGVIYSGTPDVTDTIYAPQPVGLACSASIQTCGGVKLPNVAAAVLGVTGTGNLVRSTSPTLVTPLLGTPASGVMTNMTGLALAGTPLTTRGDLLVANSTPALARLALGAANTVLHGSTTDPTYSAVVGADMTNNTVTATQLAAQYSKGSCTEVWGGSGTSFAMTSGDDAISNNSCYNDSGVTRTITAVKCRSDNAANTTVLTPTFGSAGTGTAILTGTLTCGNSYAYSSTGTLNNTAWTTGTGIDPGMSTVGNATSIAMIVEYTY